MNLGEEYNSVHNTPQAKLSEFYFLKRCLQKGNCKMFAFQNKVIFQKSEVSNISNTTATNRIPNAGLLIFNIKINLHKFYKIMIWMLFISFFLSNWLVRTSSTMLHGCG